MMQWVALASLGMYLNIRLFDNYLDNDKFADYYFRHNVAENEKLPNIYIQSPYIQEWNVLKIPLKKRKKQRILK